MAKSKSRTPLERIEYRLNRMARSRRIVLAMFIVLVFVALVYTLLDALSDDSSALVLGVSLVGVLGYGFGWFFLVGFDWHEDQEWQATRGSVMFVLAGLSSLLVMLGIIVISLILVST